MSKFWHQQVIKQKVYYKAKHIFKPVGKTAAVWKRQKEIIDVFGQIFVYAKNFKLTLIINFQ